MRVTFRRCPWCHWKITRKLGLRGEGGWEGRGGEGDRELIFFIAVGGGCVGVAIDKNIVSCGTLWSVVVCRLLVGW